MILKYSLIALLSPLAGGIVAAFLGKSMGKIFVNASTILGVTISFTFSCMLALDLYQTSTVFNQNLYMTIHLNGNSNLKLTLFGKNLLDQVARNHAPLVKNKTPLLGRNDGI